MNPTEYTKMQHGSFQSGDQYRIKGSIEIITLFRHMGCGEWSLKGGGTIDENSLEPVKKNVMSAIQTIHGKKEMLRVKIEELNKEMQELEIAEKVLAKLA